jgi:hypothetical protein
MRKNKPINFDAIEQRQRERQEKIIAWSKDVFVKKKVSWWKKLFKVFGI